MLLIDFVPLVYTPARVYELTRPNRYIRFSGHCSCGGLWMISKIIGYMIPGHIVNIRRW